MKQFWHTSHLLFCLNDFFFVKLLYAGDIENIVVFHADGMCRDDILLSLMIGTEERELP